MAEKDGEMTYEALTEIRRKEENSSYLAQIPEDFYSASFELVKSNKDMKSRLLVENPDMYDGISARSKKTTFVLERIVYVRTDKIWGAALRNALGGVNDIPENMTSEEKELYNSMLDIAKKQYSLVRTEKKTFIPELESVPSSPDIPITKPAETEEEPQAADENDPLEIPEPVAEPAVETTSVTEREPVIESTSEEGTSVEPVREIPPTEDVVIEDDEVIIRVLEDIPTIPGPERNYTLKKEEIVRLPSMIASVLINRQKAVLIKPTV